jgi:hypothetical protein
MRYGGAIPEGLFPICNVTRFSRACDTPRRAIPSPHSASSSHGQQRNEASPRCTMTIRGDPCGSTTASRRVVRARRSVPRRRHLLRRARPVPDPVRRVSAIQPDRMRFARRIVRVGRRIVRNDVTRGIRNGGVACRVESATIATARARLAVTSSTAGAGRIASAADGTCTRTPSTAAGSIRAAAGAGGARSAGPRASRGASCAGARAPSCACRAHASAVSTTTTAGGITSSTRAPARIVPA